MALSVRLSVCQSVTFRNSLLNPHASDVLSSSSLQALFRLSSGSLQALFRLSSGSLQSLFRLSSGSLQALFSYFGQL